MEVKTEQTSQRLRILSWNVNSIRALVPRLPDPAGDGDAAMNAKGLSSGSDWGCRLSRFMSNYDIVCFQETKLSSQDHVCNEAMALASVDGWSGFWAFPAAGQKKGWSGVVTFVRKGIVVSDASAKFGSFEPVSATAAEKDPKGYSMDEYNAEGRVVMTDHVDFVLFNVYFPNGRGNTRTEYVESELCRCHFSVVY